jgi:hypothetical protein
MSTTHLANPVISTNGHSCTSAKFCNWKQYSASEKALYQRMEHNYQWAVEVATAITVNVLTAVIGHWDDRKILTFCEL